MTTLGGDLDGPIGVAVDGSGNVYVAVLGFSGNPGVKKVAPGCTSSACVTTLGGGFSYPNGVALDSGGNIYVTDYVNNAVYEMAPDCASSGCVTTLGSGFKNPWGVAVDGSGNLYVSDYLNFAVKELPLATPPSLSFVATNVGSQSTDSPKAVALRNIGNAPLTFPVPATGENPSISSNFTLDVSTTCPQVIDSAAAGTLAAGASCNLSVDFLPTAAGQITGSVVLTDDDLNVADATQSIGLSGAVSTAIVPYIRVNGGAWQQTASVAVNVGNSVSLAGEDISGGSWMWSGPGGFTSASREIDAVPLTFPSDLYTLSYTNANGVTSSQAFTITINSTAITPYLRINGGAWQQTTSVTVIVGNSVSLAGQDISGGSWVWTGPNSFSAGTREIDTVPLPLPTNLYTLTYTNADGVTSTQAFTITVSPTAITPYSR